MIDGRNIICLASNWAYDPTSKHHVMRILSERNHVVWVNYHGSRRPSLTRGDGRAVLGKLRQIAVGPRRVSDGMTVVTPIVIPLPGSPTAAAINRRLLVRQIRSVLRRLPPRPVQLWSFAPDVDYLLGRFGEECAVYYCVDEFAEFTGYDRDAVLDAERRLATRADLVVTTSRLLYETKRGLNANTVLVTHGVDFDHFARRGTTRRRDVGKAGHCCTTVVADKTDGAVEDEGVIDDVDAFDPDRAHEADVAGAQPEALANVPRPIFGFWGLIQDWFDVELLAAVARARPQWSFVLIGEAATDVSPLRERVNVHLLGRRSYVSLPNYATAFDVGLIPFKRNALTEAVNPIKLREYLSAGLPVASTGLPEVRRYAQHVRIGDGIEGFIAACELALNDRSAAASQTRREAMRDETWRAKVEQLSDQVRRLTSRHAGQVVGSI